MLVYDLSIVKLIDLHVIVRLLLLVVYRYSFKSLYWDELTGLKHRLKVITDRKTFVFLKECIRIQVYEAGIDRWVQ